MKKGDIFIIIVFIIFTIIFFYATYLFLSFETKFNSNRECFEDFANKYCESIDKVIGRVTSGGFNCIEDERQKRKMANDYYFTEQEREECLG